MREIICVSLFNGMGGAFMALEMSGFNVVQKISSEVDKYAIKANDAMFTDTIQIGDVSKIEVVRDDNGKAVGLKNDKGVEVMFKEGVEIILAGGSPCQSFSFSGKRKGMATKDEQEILTLGHYLKLKDEDYEFEGQSYLFWEFVRLRDEIKPNYWFLENVEMGEKWEKVLSKAVGVNGVHVNSALLSAQNRKRVYWIGQNRERVFYYDNLCYICRKKENEQKRQFRILGKTQREGEKEILGEAQKRYSIMCNVPKKISQDRTKGYYQNLFYRMPISFKETDRQESRQGKVEDNSLDIHKQGQGEVVAISKGLQENTERERGGEEICNNRIEKEKQINISQNIQGAWSKEENEVRRNSHIAKYGEKVCCVQCGIGLDSGSYTSVITGWNKHSNKSPNTLSEMQFNEARQNNGRIFDIFKVGVVDSCLFGEKIIDIPQPKDKGILLKDILESDVDEKYYLSEKMMNYLNTRKANFNGGKINYKTGDDVASCISASPGLDISDNIIVHNTLPRSSKTGKGGTGPLSRNDGKTYCLDTGCTNAIEIRETLLSGLKSNDKRLKNFINNTDLENVDVAYIDTYNKSLDEDKSFALRTGGKNDQFLYEKKVIQLNDSKESNNGTQPFQQNRVYDVNGISPALCAFKSDLLIQPGLNDNQLKKLDLDIDSEKCNTLTLAQGRMGSSSEYMTTVSKIANITHTIRRLTPKEALRLQTVPEKYIDIMLNSGISDSQLYKMTGNGWTIEVISYLFNYIKL